MKRSDAVDYDATVKNSGNTDTIVALLLIAVMGLMIVPLPSYMLDALITVNIAISLSIFLMSIYIQKPLEFSVFPSLLLFVTLFRLALNIASTRLILLNGGNADKAAGRIIDSFGTFVVGGNFAVGIILFLILIIINFVVITKGSGRIAEVSARFTLDAMPGKQMSIDADLQNGLINDQEARTKRKSIEQEADFYGSMDGASKFVRGDAIAGLIITFINILGGIAIGVMQQNLGAGDAAKIYTIMTVGDGLVSQIPALLVSTAAGIVVTRSSTAGNLSTTLVGQVVGQQKVARIVAFIIASAALLPGMPKLVMFVIAAGALIVSYYATDKTVENKESGSGKTDSGDMKMSPEDKAKTEREELASLIPIDLVAMEVGFELIPLVDSKRDGDLLTRIGGIRKQFATELGFLIPPVHVRDNLTIAPNTYRILLSGAEVASGTVMMNRLMAMNGGTGDYDIPGVDTVEPAFGLAAKWIEVDDRELAEISGYTIVDPSTVVATHLSEILRAHAPELLGRSEAQELVDILSRSESKLVDDVLPNIMSLPEIMLILRGLLTEGVSIRDMRTIFETIAIHGKDNKNINSIIELCRASLGRQIVSSLKTKDGKLYALALDSNATSAFREAVQISGGAPGVVPLDVDHARNFLGSINEGASAFGKTGTMPVLVTEPDIRKPVWELVSRYVPGLQVISYREIDRRVQVQTIGLINV
ncbi:MAG: flagellar biosynthesis protein FlhA [Deltaproteobacteria bacterium]|nr:flagellar biosynthesis protein FlhA [Deltaproteobacteria bacterium]